jgi:O-antigen/teichoic acid export membrane protein
MSRLSRNILYNLSGQLLLAGLGFVAVKFVFKQLGGDALGIIYFTLTLNAALSSVLGMGLGETTVREVSAHFASEPRYIRSLIRTGSLFYWATYVTFAVALYYGAPVLVHRWINLKTLDPGTAIHVLRALGIASFAALPCAFYVSILRGLERMEFNNAIDVVTSALQQFGTIVILLFGGGLLPVVYWISACYGLAIIAYLLVCAHFFSWDALLPGFSISVARRNITYASSMAVISLLGMIQMQMDKVIVSKLLPIGLFGFYTVARGAASRSSSVTGAVFQGAFPHLSALDKAQERGRMLSQYRKLQDLVCFATVPIFAALIFAAMPLFTFLFDKGAAQILLLPVVFLSVGFYMNGTLTIPYVFSLAVGKPEIAARANFYALFCVLPVTFALVYFFNLPGAGFSWVFYHLFAYAYAVPRTCRECLESPTWAWYLHVLKVFALAAGTYGVAFVIVATRGQHSILPLALGYILASSLFLWGSFMLIGIELRSTLQSLFRNLLARCAEAL